MLDALKKAFAGNDENGNIAGKKGEIPREKSAELYEKAKQYFPGGVNSPVRAFKSVYGTPLFIERGDGCFLWDADGNQFIDFCCSWGPLILGHNHPKIREKVTKTLEKGLSFGAPTALENELAELILKHNRYIEKLRFVSSGTEAVMSAIRLARGYTGRDKIIKFDGCYHGHSDSLLVKAGSGLVTFGETSSAGVPKAFADETLVLPLADRQAVETAFSEFTDQIAAVIIEGIPANNGLLIQEPDYIHFLRDITRKNGSLLIFDEVITGFRLGFEGAAAYYDVHPDIITYGKIIGGGMPVGAYGASAELMGCISPDGGVYQAGTLSGNPVAMAAGLAMLELIREPGFHDELARRTRLLTDGLLACAIEAGVPFSVNRVGAMFGLFFSAEQVETFAQACACDTAAFNRFFHAMLERGVFLAPSAFEAGFVSSAHGEDVIAATLEAARGAFGSMRA